MTYFVSSGTLNLTNSNLDELSIFWNNVNHRFYQTYPS